MNLDLMKKYFKSSKIDKLLLKDLIPYSTISSKLLSLKMIRSPPSNLIPTYSNISPYWSQKSHPGSWPIPRNSLFHNNPSLSLRSCIPICFSNLFHSLSLPILNQKSMKSWHFRLSNHWSRKIDKVWLSIMPSKSYPKHKPNLYLIQNIRISCLPPQLSIDQIQCSVCSNLQLLQIRIRLLKYQLFPLEQDQWV